VNATVPVVIALVSLRPLTQYTIYCVTEGSHRAAPSRSAPLVARTAGKGTVFASVPSEPPAGHDDTAVSIELFSTITQEVRCVAVTPGVMPNATDIMMGDAASETLAFGATAIMWASAGRDIITSITDLDILAVYDVLCAGADGSVSAPLTLATGHEGVHGYDGEGSDESPFTDQASACKVDVMLLLDRYGHTA
jgi:hypothetical protein